MAYSEPVKHRGTQEEDDERDQRINLVVEAVEAFIDAKIALRSAEARQSTMDSHRWDVDETRGHLCDKLREVLS